MGFDFMGGAFLYVWMSNGGPDVFDTSTGTLAKVRCLLNHAALWLRRFTGSASSFNSTLSCYLDVARLTARFHVTLTLHWTLEHPKYASPFTDAT